MPSRSVFASALLASSVAANPMFFQRDTSCGATDGDQIYVAEVGFFSDDSCQTQIQSQCIYTTQEAIDDGPGWYICQSNDLPTDTPYYAKVNDAAQPDIQMDYTQDKSCPPTGPGAIVATLNNGGGCVEMNIGGDMPGLTIWPSGGSTVARKAKRDTTSCTGFTTASQESSYSNSVQVSNIVDCTNSADNGCTITEGEQHTESVSTSFSTTAGFEVEGLSLGATFGTEYTDSEASSLQEGFTIDAGQKGYLSAFSTATLFKGTFTGCDDGDQDGEVLAIKENGFTYSVIYTDA